MIASAGLRESLSKQRNINWLRTARNCSTSWLNGWYAATSSSLTGFSPVDGR